ncbi:hypothetical protein OHA21_44430 [Actinoplanes sp. NBC_00393]|uniref:hypothetical protein n=1 Tax=Actinoplanes sp. NBC_00393 TaxID=2975953 RepID=UPI002E1EFC64
MTNTGGVPRDPARPAGVGLIPRLLMSPFSGLLPDGLVVLRYTSSAGALITLPVQAAATTPHGLTFVVAVGQASTKRWWRHFRRPAQVQVWLSGTWHPAIGQVKDSAAAFDVYRRRFSRARPDGTWVLVELRFIQPAT